MSPAADAATRTAYRSTRFVAWVRAWRAGLVPFDDLADEIAEDEEHLVADAPGTWTDVPLGQGLPIFAKLRPDDIHLVLPVPGDPRGLPGPGPLTGAALLAGEAVITPEFGLVPEVRRHTSGSGVEFETVVWQALPAPEHRPGFQIDAAEAESQLTAALAEATTRLTKLDVAQWKPELAGALQALRRPESTATLPPGFDPRSRRLFARAIVLDQVLALAGSNAPGGAVNGFEARQRDEALRPLTAACRQALVAACNAPLHA
ncbi:hypothetical protein [Actinoplanes regularis]|uniref:Uncharacterized protein n=1 Tax=Actinoplanes regularis TaxID=52697 RepID=A0A238WAI0_9ACTN|nr:hypothetical protein [Actinoplanes regularis]GIE85087.1 hypothetical protein Are01nite_15670 [Actinoplanes regularis]SNR43596.1 hypothetical protein SAMN06264365_102342 [Actinoplanes regularis]